MNILQIPESFQLADSLPQIMWVVDMASGQTYLNRFWFEYIGEADLAANLWERVMHPQDRAAFLQLWQEARSQGTAWEAFYRLKRKDGIYRWHLARSNPVKESSGDIIKWVGTATDVDDLKKVEEGQRFLAESSEILSSSLDLQTTLDAITQLAIKRFEGWCTVHLLEASKIVLKSVAHTDPAKINYAFEFNQKFPAKREAAHGIAQVFRTGKCELVSSISEDMVRLVARDDEHLRLIKELGLRSFISCPLKHERETFGVITFIATDHAYDKHDLELASELARRFSLSLDNSRLFSEQLKDKEEVELLVKKLKKAVESRDTFVGICSHELKTPVTSLKLLSQISLRRIEKDQFPLDRINIENTFNKFGKQIDHMSDLIDTMLDVSRIDSGKLILHIERLNLQEIAREVYDKFAKQLQSLAIPFKMQLAEDLFIQGDRLRVEQVLSNLISNAIKYGNRLPIHLSLEAEEGRAVLSLTDQGVGISSEDQERIFQRFDRANTDFSISGLGLGLFISKVIIDAHEGLLTLDSTPGRGSTFKIHLPLERA